MLLEKEENSGIAPVFDEAGRPVYVLYCSLGANDDVFHFWSKEINSLHCVMLGQKLVLTMLIS